MRPAAIWLWPSPPRIGFAVIGAWPALHREEAGAFTMWADGAEDTAVVALRAPSRSVQLFHSRPDELQIGPCSALTDLFRADNPGYRAARLGQLHYMYCIRHRRPRSLGGRNLRSKPQLRNHRTRNRSVPVPDRLPVHGSRVVRRLPTWHRHAVRGSADWRPAKCRVRKPATLQQQHRHMQFALTADILTLLAEEAAPERGPGTTRSLSIRVPS